MLSLLTIISIDFYLNQIPEYFDLGSEIGNIIYKISLSYISAFIFYFLVVHIKQQKDKEALYTYISRKVYSILGDAKGLINELTKETGIDVKNTFPNEDELNEILKRINPHEKAPLFIARDQYANWIQYFNYKKQRTVDSIDKIFKKMPFLETQLVNKLANIEDCSHYSVLNVLVSNYPIRNQDMTAFRKSISDYFEMIEELERYADKNLKGYK